MIFSDRELSRRLERAEGHACAGYAEAHRLLEPESGAVWSDRDGVFTVFDGVDSPVTQTFGLGLFAEATPARLDEIEDFFTSRGASVDHEVSPFAGVETLEQLCGRGYVPLEMSTVLYQPVRAGSDGDVRGDIRVRAIGNGDREIWTEVSARGWSHEHPELEGFLRGHGAVSAARADSLPFLAEVGGVPGAAGVLCLHEGVALFGGSATVPELRRRGLQAALLAARMRSAHEHGCDVAMMVAAPGSNSQRNAERAGFRVAYTRIKWRLAAPAAP